MSRLFSAFTLFLLALPSTIALAEVRVLTSIKPLQLIAAAVQDDLGKPEVLLPPGASPHHYALRPSDVRNVRDAELLYWIGADLESFLPRVLAGRSKPHVAVQNIPGMSLRHFGDSPEAHKQESAAHDEHGDHDEHEAEEAADEHDHDHGDHEHEHAAHDARDFIAQLAHEPVRADGHRGVEHGAQPE